MNWRPRVREAFETAALPDEDVVEELAQHAASAYEAALAESGDSGEAERQVEAQIASWASDPVVKRRRPHRPALDEAPTAGRSRLAGFAHEIRTAFRLLGRQPGYALVAIATMALGVGATTVLFSVAYGVLLRPLPWLHSERLVRLSETRQGSPSRFGPVMSNASYMAWRDHATTIDGLAAYTGQTMTMGGTGEAARARVGMATPGLFPLLGVDPVIGSRFQADDGGPGRELKVMLSYGVWQERFGGSPRVLGQTLRLDGEPYRIVGVMPRSFAFPDRETRAWIPFRVPPVVVTKGGGSLSIFRAIARLRPGVTPAQAAAEATSRSRNAPNPGLVVVAIFGTNGPIQVSAAPLLETETAQVRPAILVFLAAVALLLVTATANVASVQLARATARRREIAIRSALGAGAGRLVRQFLVESIVLGLSGGVVGLLFAAAVTRALPALLPPQFPRMDDVRVDLLVMVFAIAVSLAASIVFGLLPALQARRVNVSQSLAEDGTAPTGGGTRSRAARTRAIIMCGQMAIACLLLVGAALLTRSFVALTRVDAGYDPMNVLTARLALPDGMFAPVRRAELLGALIDRLRRVPGVTRAAFTSALPLTPGDIAGSFTMRSPRTGAMVTAHAAVRIVSPDYFAALGVKVTRGRALRDSDTATTARVVVVNESFAKAYLTARAVGDRLPGEKGETEVEVVGVVEDVHHRSVTDLPAPELYQSYRQGKEGISVDEPKLVLRTARDPAALVPTLRALVREQDASVAFDAISTMQDLVTGSLAQPRLYAILLGGLAAFAAAIAGVGLFGVLAYSVAQRSREIGVRTALGARPIDIAVLVVRQGGLIVAAGAVVGFGAAAALARLLSTFLFGVTPFDAVSFATVAAALAVVAALACLVPARRAARVDPVRVLRG